MSPTAIGSGEQDAKEEMDMGGMDLKKLGAGVAVAEAERDARKQEGFMADLFRGKANFNLFLDCEKGTLPSAVDLDVILKEFYSYLTKNVDPDKIERENEVSPEIIKWLCEHGYFGLKMPEEYDGKNLTQADYSKVLALAASWCGGIVVPLSAANTIGLGFPVKNYGTPEQKKKWLPSISTMPTGFAFTEAEAGSDPAAMTTCAVRVKDDKGNVVGYKLSGQKWWTTNGPKDDKEFLSPLLCVIAKTIDKPEDLKDPNYRTCFSAFILPVNTEGVKVQQRCNFEGLRGMYNGNWDLNDVYLPKDQLIGEKEGLGFKIALEALNTGRLSIAALCSAIAKQCLLMGKWYGQKRIQWGKPIIKHETIGSGILAKDLATTLAMEAMVWFATGRVDQKKDARMEAATCKVYASERGWNVVDNLMQICGGRGYETTDSLKKRGEVLLPVERTHRDFRPNRIFEGSSQILTLWVMREGVDEYKRRGDEFEKGALVKKAKVALSFALDIAKHMIPRSIDKRIKKRVPRKLHQHLKFVEKYSRKLARRLILTSARYQAKMIVKQLLLSRFFWIASELYAMTAVCFYSQPSVPKDHGIDGKQYVDLADLYCLEAAQRIKVMLKEVNNNTDDAAYKVAKKLMGGEYDDWMKNGIIPLTEEMKLE